MINGLTANYILNTMELLEAIESIVVEGNNAQLNNNLATIKSSLMKLNLELLTGLRDENEELLKGLMEHAGKLMVNTYKLLQSVFDE